MGLNIDRKRDFWTLTDIRYNHSPEVSKCCIYCDVTHWIAYSGYFMTGRYGYAYNLTVLAPYISVSVRSYSIEPNQF